MLAVVHEVDGAAGVAQGAKADLRLGKAAHQFEALMMKELVAPMNHPGALFADESEEHAGALGEFASEALAGALSAHGGLGIAERIVHSFSRRGTEFRAPGGMEEGEKNTRISRLK